MIRWFRACILMVGIGALWSGCGSQEKVDPVFAYTNQADIRLTDGDYEWSRKEGAASHCARCHQRSNIPNYPQYNVAKAITVWDLDTKPVWTDGVKDEVLKKLLLTEKQGGKLLPLNDMNRLSAFIDKEIARREKIRKGL